MMIQTRLGAQIHDTAAGPGLGIWGTVDDLRQARMEHGAKAHGAGFQRDIQPRAGQAVIIQPPGGRTQSNHLGMSGRVPIQNRAVVSGGKQPPLRVEHHGSDRNLAQARRQTGLVQSKRHGLAVVQDIRSGMPSHDRCALSG